MRNRTVPTAIAPDGFVKTTRSGHRPTTANERMLASVGRVCLVRCVIAPAVSTTRRDAARLDDYIRKARLSPIGRRVCATVADLWNTIFDDS